MTRRERAMRLFTSGYNCSQSLVLAFADLLPLDAETLARVASSFGGGMGRLREVCGAVTGMFAVVGFLYGYSTPETGDVKAEHYARVQELAHSFESRRGTLLCRELLGLTVRHDDFVPEARTEAYYASRPCAAIIGDAAEILESYIESHPIPGHTET